MIAPATTTFALASLTYALELTLIVRQGIRLAAH